jgi:hypothetical protein
MRKWRNESGQVLVLTALSMTMLLGLMGLAVDVGQLFHAKRSLQIGADDAAVSGVLAYKYGTEAGKSSSAISTDIQNAAAAALAANGLSSATVTSSYSSNVTTPTLFVASPPADGPNRGTTGFVEAILTVPQSTIFMGLFGFRSVNVMTRAVAGVGSASSGCIYVLNPTNASPAAYFAGNFNVQAPSCGVVVDGTSNCVMQFNGTSGELNAGSVSIQGGACGQSGDSNPRPTTGGYVADPLQQVINWPAVPPASPTDCTVTDTTTTSITTSPSYGSNSIVCFSQPVTISNSSSPSSCGSSGSPWLVLPSAMYVFEQGVTFNGGCVESASGGVTFDLTGATKQGSTWYSMQVATQTNFNLTGMTSSITTSGGTSLGNQGVVIEQPPSNTATISINQGTSIGSITGTIYAPTGQLALIDQGGTGSTGGTPALTLTVDIIVGTLSDQASNINITNPNGAGQTSNALTKVVLVE